MKTLFLKICGTCASSYQVLIARAMKAGGPISGLIGFAGDMGTPVANFILYLTLSAAALTAVCGFVWFGTQQRKLRRAMADGRLSQQELEEITEHSPWSIGFAFGLVGTVILSLFMLFQKLAAEEDKGILATLVPALENVQKSLFNLEKDVKEVKQTTDRIEAKTEALAKDSASTKQAAEEIKDTTQKVLTKLEDLSAAFEAAGKGGVIISNPSTPAEHYHNARLQELKSDFGAARKSYNAYLASGVDFVDPYLAYTDMLKVQDGLEGAREIVATMKRTNTTASLEVASALLLGKEQRIAALKQSIEKHPDFAPAVYLLSREFSLEKLGEQTLADKREEKALLTKFRELDTAGKFQRYFLDKKQARGWLDDADKRTAALAALPATVLENPVTLTTMIHGTGWNLTLGFTDYKIKGVEYRLDGQGDFTSTGFLPTTSPQTGLPMPNPSIPIPFPTPGEHKLEVRYTDMADKVNGPYTLTFNTNDAALKEGKNMLALTATSWVSVQNGNIYFTQILTQRGILKTIAYSLNSDALDQSFPFDPPKPGEGPYTVGDKIPYIPAPAGLQYVAVQLTFSDGSKSDVKKFQAAP